MCETDSVNKKEKIKFILKNSLKIIKQYEWLINSYVLDFFVDKHWEKLSDSWKSIEKLNPEKLSELLESERRYTVVWPLSILSLKIILENLVISRESNQDCHNISSSSNNKLLLQSSIKNKFEKGIKLKKRHEVNCMSEITNHIASKTGVKLIVDFGAGLGHFARILSYGYNLQVCCLEMQQSLNENARILDKELELFLNKTNKFKCNNPPEHITMTLTNKITSDMFKSTIRKAFKLNDTDKFEFGIVGLHPCGDLAAILIKMFLQCKEAKFLNLVGCCYMKLTQNNFSQNSGYPVSSFLQDDLKHLSLLSYESREIACHAIEMYMHRLKNGNYTELKVHAFRATIEQIIVRKYPDKKHIALRNVKYTNDLDFIEYCKKATKGTEIDIMEDIIMIEANKNLNQWKNIVVFYTLRLVFAPLIESIILYDRILYLLENGCEVNIEAICDPIISPRNHITTAIKPL